MASLMFDAKGRAIVQFTRKGQRKTLRLGAVDQRAAKKAQAHVEHLCMALDQGTIPPDTAKWLDVLSDRLHGRLSAVGLVPARVASTPTFIGPFLDSYIEGRTDLKRQTLENLKQCRRELVKFFGRNRLLASLTRGEAGDWRRKLLARKLAPATVATHVKKARQMFADAVDRRLIAENPFDKLRAGSQRNAERMKFVAAADVRRVIGCCPGAEWRLIFALARFGGLRIPSELHALKWADVRFDQGRMTVASPKTAHVEGKASREVPLFPELLPYLLEALEAAEAGAVHVIARCRGENLRTRAESIVRRSGVIPWPKLFQNLRSSRQTELEERFPTHVVCAWMGNSEPVARRHYLQVTDEHFERAADSGSRSSSGSGDGSAAKSAAVSAGQDRTDSEPKSKNPRKSEGFAESKYPQGGLSGQRNLLGNLKSCESALQKALHASRKNLSRHRRRSITKLRSAMDAARKGVRR